MCREDHPLTREDFDDSEEWLRFCHEGGLDPYEAGAHEAWRGGRGGHWAKRFAATYAESPDYIEPWAPTEKPSHYLTLAEFEAAHNGVAFANCRGRLMNTFISITWSTLGILDDVAVSRALHLFLAGFDDWSRAAGEWPAYVWALERGPRWGLHSHILAAVPPPMVDEFRVWCGETVARIARRPLVDTLETKTLDVKRLHPGVVEEQWSMLRYLFKGLSPHIMSDQGGVGAPLPFWQLAALNPKSQGEISVGRAGLSGDLAPESIQAWAATHPLPAFPAMAAVNSPVQLYEDRFFAWGHASRGPSLWP